MTSSRTRFAQRCALTIFALLWTVPLLAHHPMGGEAPQTFWHGLLSGIGHPVIGLEHLAFILAIGILCAVAGLRRLRVPLLLVAATVLGSLLQWLGMSVPFSEVLVAVSVILAGALVIRTPSAMSLAALPAVMAAVFHGLAYGEAVIGAAPMPVVAYLLGFSLVQMAIGTLAFLATARLIRQRAPLLARGRIVTGGCISAVGIVTLTMLALGQGSLQRWTAPLSGGALPMQRDRRAGHVVPVAVGQLPFIAHIQ